jgi:uncharacterized protein (DUF885 family)
LNRLDLATLAHRATFFTGARFAAICAALALLPCGASSRDALPPTASSDGAYAAIARAYFYDGFREAPSGATSTGFHAYDAKLDDLSASAYARHLARDASVLGRLRALDGATLSTDAALDRTMLEDQILDDQLLTGTLAQWRHNPDLYVGTASGSLYALIERRFAPAAVRLSAAIARERQVPRLLAQARANLQSVDAATKTVSELDAIGAASFIADDVPAAFAGVGDASARRAFVASTAAATAAMRAYARYVRAIRPSGTYAIGRAAYRRRLEYEDGLNLSIPAYLAIGQAALARDRARFIATAHRIDGKAPVLATYATLARRRPAPSLLLRAAADDLVRLRAFVISHHIVTLPADADISVTATPKFQRSFVTAQEDSPGPLERGATKTYYNVTPPDPAWPLSRQDGYVSQLNDFQRPLISAHEVYPGHFVNYAIDKHLSLSLTRRLIWNSEFGEGWAHYGEQMVVDEGWGNGDPRVRLAQLSEALLRECRFVAGVKLHTAGWSLARSERFFRDACFQSSAVATEESLRGTQDPMYGYYTLGKLMILKLRADYRRKTGSGYTLQRFHDALLAHGDPPLPLLRPLMLGNADDGHPL